MKLMKQRNVQFLLTDTPNNTFDNIIFLFFAYLLKLLTQIYNSARKIKLYTNSQ